MAMVDGVTTAPDANGKIQGNGGDVDKMAGGSGNDQLQGHADFNQYYGGAGNDTFVLAAKFGQETEVASKDFGTLATYITDFRGAGGPGAGEQDFINLSGFGSDAKLDLLGAGAETASGAKVYYYSIFNSDTGDYYNFAVNSLNGKALDTGDFNFYAPAHVA
ncbi:hypothetical protein [Methylobacterium sp. 37f]|uniref:hypothetical protein n=1 Tax=Methylobacterium sp. 37f TaxID=2817058 RepID=UPI001FFD0B25|nr:hypothetical protein [Methylobacterium sp. 37f]MCK2055586.1 hypothetical protein [Methylobacterium sp. 37f]